MEYPDNIQALLKKYWEAETTLEEETQLREYFSQHPDSGAGMYFQFIQKEKAVEMDNPPSYLRPVATRRTLVVRSLMRYAAAAIVLVAIGFLVFTAVKDTGGTTGNTAIAYQDSFEDPQKAYDEAREALLLVAQKINSTQSRAAKNVSMVDPYTKIVKPISSH